MQLPELPDSSHSERESFSRVFLHERTRLSLPQTAAGSGDRRWFRRRTLPNLLASGQRSATAALPAGNVRPEDLEIIDTHQHLWNLKSQRNSPGSMGLPRSSEKHTGSLNTQRHGRSQRSSGCLHGS